MVFTLSVFFLFSFSLSLQGDVEKSLLPKQETKLYIGLSAMQMKFYKSILDRNMADFAVAGQVPFFIFFIENVL